MLDWKNMVRKNTLQRAKGVDFFTREIIIQKFPFFPVYSLILFYLTTLCSKEIKTLFAFSVI